MDTKTEGLRVAFIGSFEPYYTTENELADAMERNGMVVEKFTERDPGRIETLIDRIIGDEGYDFVMWVSTKGHRDRWPVSLQWGLIGAASQACVPLVGYHLDRWWGLEREHWLDEPYYQIDLMVTADGGHDDMWETKGIKHRWLPPGISERWCQPGMWREEYACDVMFVGNWRPDGQYHPEWQHRRDLINFLDQHWGQINRPGHRGLRLIPKRGHPQLRGLELNDAYWSAKVVVGDSCLVPRRDGNPITRYCSDRVPETLGRGGILVHPSVEGIDDTFLYGWEWDIGDWASLRQVVDRLVSGEAWSDPSVNYSSREEYVASQMQWMREAHTYTVRIRQLVDIMHEEGLL